MSSGFETWPSEVVGFLKEVADNNNRDWWTENKHRYDEMLKAPALLMLDVVADHLGDMTGSDVTTKLFRPHRDVRFSKDKTPYNTHLHMLWTTSRGGVNLGYFCGISPEYFTLGGGVMQFEKPELIKYRDAIAAPASPLAKAVNDGLAKGFTLREPQLKRVPSPYPKDHPNAELLKRKGLALWYAFDAGNNVIDVAQSKFTDIWPFQKILADALS